eukprot:RCo006811
MLLGKRGKLSKPSLQPVDASGEQLRAQHQLGGKQLAQGQVGVQLQSVGTLLCQPLEVPHEVLPSRQHSHLLLMNRALQQGLYGVALNDFVLPRDQLLLEVLHLGLQNRDLLLSLQAGQLGLLNPGPMTSQSLLEVLLVLLQLLNPVLSLGLNSLRVLQPLLALIKHLPAGRAFRVSRQVTGGKVHQVLGTLHQPVLLHDEVLPFRNGPLNLLNLFLLRLTLLGAPGASLRLPPGCGQSIQHGSLGGKEGVLLPLHFLQTIQLVRVLLQGDVELRLGLPQPYLVLQEHIPSGLNGPPNHLHLNVRLTKLLLLGLDQSSLLLAALQGGLHRAGFRDLRQGARYHCLLRCTQVEGPLAVNNDAHLLVLLQRVCLDGLLQGAHLGAQALLFCLFDAKLSQMLVHLSSGLSNLLLNPLGLELRGGTREEFQDLGNSSLLQGLELLHLLIRCEQGLQIGVQLLLSCLVVLKCLLLLLQPSFRRAQNGFGLSQLLVPSLQLSLGFGESLLVDLHLALDIRQGHLLEGLAAG